jgi:transcriptional regulator GlxA family with amidase domain
MHLRAETAGFDWLRLSQELIARELTSGRAGGAAIAARLADAVFIEAVRSWFAEQHADRSDEVAAMQDPAVALALTLLHRDPQRRWTVATLARNVALSRAGIAERFRVVVGESPMRYLTRHRLTRAMRLLRSSRVAEIARTVGYESEAAFCRAFARYTGITPAAFRRRDVRPADTGHTSR